MNESLEYIEAYFEKTLTEQEKQSFEERCINDEDFASDVAFYITSREAIRQKLLEQKKKLWVPNVLQHREIDSTTMAPVRKMPYIKWLAYAAAACVVLAIGMYFIFSAPNTQGLAHNYVQQNLTHLSPTMDGSKDILQKGIGAYNEGNYDVALSRFQALYQSHPDNSEALEYAGRAYLMKKDYDKALLAFDGLANKKLFSNWGPFYKAVTLLERNKKGDKEAAKKLLEQVRDQGLEGKKEAQEWLSKW